MAQHSEWLELQERLYAMRNEAQARSGIHAERPPKLRGQRPTKKVSGDSPDLQQLDHAISRMELGLYPLCERCGVRIEMELLQQTPQMTVCGRCTRAERRG